MPCRARQGIFTNNKAVFAENYKEFYEKGQKYIHKNLLHSIVVL